MAERVRERRARGGRGGYEPPLLVREREVRVMQLSVRGRTQREIAAEVGVSQAAVSKILRRLEDRLLATLPRERIRLLPRLLMRTEHVYRQAQDGWERSCADRQYRRQRRITNTTGTGGERDIVEVATEPQAGDPRFLREQLRAIGELRTTLQLQGLDWVEIAAALEKEQPQPVEQTDQSAPKETA